MSRAEARAGAAAVPELPRWLSREDLLDRLLGGAGPGLVVLDGHRRIAYAAPGAAALLGVPGRELVGTPFKDWLVAAPGAHVPDPDELAGRLAPRAPVHLPELWLRGPGDEPVAVDARFDPVFEGERRRGWVVLLTDVGERVRAGRALARERDLARRYLDIAGVVLVAIGADERVSLINRMGAEVLGCPESEILGRNWFDTFLPEGCRAEVRRRFRRVACGEAEIRAEAEHEVLTRGGETRLIAWTNTVLRDEEGRFVATLSSGTDVTEQRRISAAMAHQASHDALTGLINRRVFEERLSRVIETARADGSEHALCYLDLDQFKVVNDTCGHVAGDELLRQIGAAIGRHIRRRDTLARLGGDEFAVLMEHCSLEQARRVARGVRNAVEEYRFLWEGSSFSLGVSIGVVPITAASESAVSAMSAADSACYAAKDAGRNRVHVYRPDDTELARRHGEMQWVSRIHQALEAGRLRLDRQPIVALAGAPGAGLDYEVLLRMEDEDGQTIPPGAFLPAAERYGLATRLDRWTLGQVLAWLGARAGHLDELERCWINLSNHTLAEEDFLDHVHEQLDLFPVPAEKLCFEITETAAIANLSAATRFIRSLKRRGASFALDDFGSGLSSFAYLKTLPVDFLKIDGMFVRDIVTDPMDLAMVRSINDIGHVMGKRTVAESVETAAVRDRLRELGVDYAQGYGVARPTPLDSAARRRD